MSQRTSMILAAVLGCGLTAAADQAQTPQGGASQSAERAPARIQPGVYRVCKEVANQVHRGRRGPVVKDGDPVIVPPAARKMQIRVGDQWMEAIATSNGWPVAIGKFRYRQEGAAKGAQSGNLEGEALVMITPSTPRAGAEAGCDVSREKRVIQIDFCSIESGSWDCPNDPHADYGHAHAVFFF